MGKRKLEWQENGCWRYVSLEPKVSRNNNYFVKHNGEVYVFANLKEGQQVMKKVNGKWIQVGRITRAGEIYIGEGLSYDETIYKQYKEAKAKGETTWVKPTM